MPLEAFGKSSKAKDGHRRDCKKCRTFESKSYRQRYPEKLQATAKRYYLANSDKIKARRKKYNIDNAEYIAIWQKAYRERNAEKIAEMKRDWRKRNADWADDASKRWQANNKELVRKYHQESKKRHPDRDRNYYLANTHVYREASAKRRAKIKNLPKYKITKKDIDALMRKPCIYCGKKAEHLDHVVPIARGGLHTIGNLAPACANCNLSKGPKFVTEWRYR